MRIPAKELRRMRRAAAREVPEYVPNHRDALKRQRIFNMLKRAYVRGYKDGFHDGSTTNSFFNH